MFVSRCSKLKTALLVAAAANSAVAAAAADIATTVPSTVSSSIQPQYQTLMGYVAAGRGHPSPPSPGPDDVAGWDAANVGFAKLVGPLNAHMLAGLSCTATPDTIGGVPVLDIRPKQWTRSLKVLVYVHGGGYTLGSARMNLYSAALAATATGLRVISVDYTTAPRGKWPQVTDQVIAATRALVTDGRKLADIAMLGDSAGGGLVAGAVLKMRDLGYGMPAAVVLWSPWTDLSGAGDSRQTLASVDPLLTPGGLDASAAAYADQKDRLNPYVSPVYGNYRKGFPPTLIQVGTRELLLSDAVREYHAISDAGGDATIDPYEGMPHVFQALFASTEETTRATKVMADFLQSHVARKQR